MRIDPKSRIAGYPSLHIRDLLRRRATCLTPAYASKHLGVSVDQARGLISSLEKEGWIEPINDTKPPCSWRCTNAGAKLALASASRAIKRATAERLLSEFMERVRSINDDAGFLYTISRVAVFGSYLTDTEDLSDLDLAVEIEPRTTDKVQFRSLAAQRVAEAQQNGWAPRNKFELAAYPHTEIYKVLIGGKSAISLHGFPELDELGCAFRVLLGG